MTDLSKEYAAAFFMLACEKGMQQEFADALGMFRQVFEDEPDYFALLSSPAIPLGERLAVIDEAFSSKVPEDAVFFLKLLCEKGRISCFFDAEVEYRNLLDASNHVEKAKIRSAAPLTEDQKKELVAKLEKVQKCTVLPEYVIDESLLGGVIVEIDGKIIDGSLRKSLRDVKEVMSQ